MELTNQTLLILGIILFFGLFLPLVFEKLHLPFTTSLLIAGSALGPNGLNYIQPDKSLMIFGVLGATFHMLLAGFESEIMHLKFSGKEFWAPFLFGGVMPGLVGMAITLIFGYNLATALFVGAVFLSSSIMLVFSFVKTLNISRLKVGRIMKSMTVVQDLIGTLLIFLVFKSLEPHARFPLPILFGLLISAVIVLRMFLPEIVTYFFERMEKTGDEYEERTRLVVSLLLVSIFLFSLLDVHPVIAAFLVGFSLSSIPNLKSIRNKLHTIGYAVFIPIFLFIVGLEIDLKILTSFDVTNLLLVFILVGSIGAKIAGGFISGRILKFNTKDSFALGVSASAKLTVSLSATYIALQKTIVDQRLFSAIILISVLSSVITPIILNLIYRAREEVL